MRVRPSLPLLKENNMAKKPEIKKPEQPRQERSTAIDQNMILAGILDELQKSNKYLKFLAELEATRAGIEI